MKNFLFFVGGLLCIPFQMLGYDSCNCITSVVDGLSPITENTGLYVSTYQVAHEVQQVVSEQTQINSVQKQQKSSQKDTYKNSSNNNSQLLERCDQGCRNVVNSLQKDRSQKSLERSRAAEQSIQTRHAREEKSYSFTTEEEVVLHAYKIDVGQFKRIPGTILQHHLFQETVACMKEVARAAWTSMHYMANGPEVVSEALELSMLSCDCTASHHYPLAMKINDTCELLANYTTRICLQAVDSVFGLAGAVMNPRETIEQVSTSLVPLFAILGETLAFADNQGSVSCAGLVVDEEQYWKDIAGIRKGVQSAQRQFSEKSFEDKVFATTQLACDCVVHTALLAKIGKFFSGLWNRSAWIPYSLRPVEPVVEQEYQVLKRLSPELELVEQVVAGRQLPMGADSFSLQHIYSDTSFADVVASMSSRAPTYVDMYECLLEKQVKIIGQSFYDLLPTEKKAIVDSGGMLSQRACITDQQSIKNIVAEAESSFHISEHIQQEIVMLKEKYPYFMGNINGIEEKITIDIEHIFIPKAKPEFLWNKALKQKELRNIKISGWHYDMWQDLFDQGLITILKKYETSDGCVFLDMFWKYGKKDFDKTFFPKSWSREKCVEKIIEAFRVAEEIEERSNDFNKIFEGVTAEKILIEFRLSRDIENIWHMDTVFVSKDYFGVK